MEMPKIGPKMSAEQQRGYNLGGGGMDGCLCAAALAAPWRRTASIATPAGVRAGSLWGNQATSSVAKLVDSGEFPSRLVPWANCHGHN